MTIVLVYGQSILLEGGNDKPLGLIMGEHR